MDNRHAAEKKCLEKQHKNEKSATKQKPKETRKAIESRQQQEMADLESKHAKENKYPLGKQKQQIENSTEASQGTQVSAVTSNNQQQNISSNPASKINTQELQLLHDQTKSLIAHDKNSQSDSFDKIMQDRSQALQLSLSNPAPTTVKII